VEREFPCATVEGIIVLKLYALPSLYRQGNLVRAALYETDLLTLIHWYRPDLESLFHEIAPHVSTTDLVALRKIAAEIQERIARFGQVF
jgi:predicted nucleotidyltransferase